MRLTVRVISNVFILLFGLNLLSVKILSAQMDSCQIASDAIDQASQIRGLKSKKRVPCLVHDKEEVKSYLLSIIDKQLPEEKLRNEELVYKVLGFFPESFDYKHGVVDLYLSQIGGYYDPEKDHFVMAKWLPANMQTGIAVHELTHALQDQHYDLEKIVDLNLNNSDALLARSALIEGDATAVMFDYDRKLNNQQSIKVDDNVDGFLLGSLASLAGAASQQVPKSLQMVLIFPYTSGFRFAHHLLKRGGYEELSKVYRDLPRSTEEILHPELYGTEAGNPKIIPDEVLKDSSVPVGHTMRYVDTLGEFGISALLSMLDLPAAQSGEASRGWGGDRLGLFTGSDKDKGYVVWHTLWDTQKDSAEFCEAVRIGYSKRAPALKTVAGSQWVSDSNNRRLKIHCDELSVKLYFEHQ